MTSPSHTRISAALPSAGCPSPLAIDAESCSVQGSLSPGLRWPGLQWAGPSAPVCNPANWSAKSSTSSGSFAPISSWSLGLDSAIRDLSEPPFSWRLHFSDGDAISVTKIKIAYVPILWLSPKGHKKKICTRFCYALVLLAFLCYQVGGSRRSTYGTQTRCTTWFSIVVRRSMYRANGIPLVTKLSY